jgi:hypothetical protein
MTTESKCPMCGSKTREVWHSCDPVSGSRTMRRECLGEPEDGEHGYCPWNGEPYLPPIKPVEVEKDVFQHSWHYVVHDDRGYVMTVSRGFSDEATCDGEARRDLTKVRRTMPGAVAVVWPPTARYTGKLLEL